MSASLTAYRIATRCLEPLLGPYLRHRVRRGKERAERLGERLGRPQIPRPDGPLIWMHGASVGETGLLIEVFKALRAERKDVTGLITSQTLTSADRISGLELEGVIHQMAPADGPQAVDRFFDHWRPDAGVFAEGEIWPNLLLAAQKRGVPLVLANARMTESSRKSWRRFSGAAQRLFASFQFVSAADQATADAIAEHRKRPTDAVGNLKRAADAPACDPDLLLDWRRATANRSCVLAASTHPSEEALALAAFKLAFPDPSAAPLLILAPRHPDRAHEVIGNLVSADLSFQRRSQEMSPIGDAAVLLADTIGEMGLWLRLADTVYLGGAHAQGVGGHNPVEALKLRRPVRMGPHAFNFADLVDALTPTKAVGVANDAGDLADFWRAPPTDIDWAGVDAVFADVEETLAATLAAIKAALDEGRRHA